jgi:hypothetical protein
MSISFLAQSQVQIYFNDFETAGGFYTDTINNIWERGIPQKAVIDTAHSGQNVWLTDLDSAYQGAQNSFLYSPQIVIAPFDSGYISFWQFVDLDTSLLSGKDICNISYRKGADTNWLSLGYQGFAGANNWFNTNSAGTMGWHYDSSGWFNSGFPFYRNHSGSYFYQVDTVQFRFSFRSYANHSGAGWAIDDFGVYGWNMPVDLGIESIVYPVDTTTISDSVSISIVVKNYGIDTLFNSNFKVVIDSSYTFTEQVSFPSALKPDSSITLTLSKKYSTPKTKYHLFIESKLSGDSIYFNDTISKHFLVKNGKMDLKIINIEVNPSMQFGDTIFTCYFRPTYVSFKAVNISSDTIKSATFNYYSYLWSYSNQWLLNNPIAPGDTLSHTFSYPYMLIYEGFYELFVKGKVVYPSYVYIDTDTIKLYAIRHNYKSSGDTLYKWCPVGGGIKEIGSKNPLTISPNPALNSINLKMDDRLLPVKCSISIYGICGKEMKQLTIPKTNKSINIDISTLPPGLYYIHLKSDNQILGIGKFIKE